MSAQAGAAAALAAATAAAAAAASQLRFDEDLPPRDDLAVVRLRRRIDGDTRVWRLQVDGQDVDELGMGERIQFYVHPGAHLLEILAPLRRLLGGGNARLELHAAAGNVLELVCRLQYRPPHRPAIVIEPLSTGRIVGNGPAPTGPPGPP